ncbi:MAG: crotonase [Acidobacteria bacterium]|nr:MAG: crotonase [Acidobacteriota bacterium]REK00546.1 MAG: crotonase [Acidobacteriota bacterium]
MPADPSQSSEQAVLCRTEGRVAILTINRPDKLNALNQAVESGMLEHLERLADDDGVGCLVVTGAGEKSFVAGADIGEFEGRSPLEQRQAMAFPRVFDVMADYPKPVVAMIGGFCLGGGCELASSCDLRIASSRARFGQPEINLGLLPGGGGTQRLPRLIGMGQAMKLILTGAMIDAAEALRIGLVDEVVEPEQLEARCLELASEIASKSPVALRLAKEATRAAERLPLGDGLVYERDLFALAFSTEDKVEGVQAFLAKRKPSWKGR